MTGGPIKIVTCGSCTQPYALADGHNDCPAEKPRRPVDGVPYRPPVDSGLSRKSYPSR